MASTEMDHWVGVATRIAGTKEPTALEVELSAFNGALSLRTFLVVRFRPRGVILSSGLLARRTRL